MKDNFRTEVWEGVTYKVRHGCPFDRGMSDSWYSRAVSPHYFVGDTHGSRRVQRMEMTEAEVAEYIAGYAFNEDLGGKKDWG
jgi:hypothetical protein